MESEADHRLLLIFDGDCSFCRAWVEYWKNLTSKPIRYASFQEVAEQFPRVSREQFASAVKLILPDGEVRSRAHAVSTALTSVPGKRLPLWLYERIPGAGTVSEAMYGVAAR
jgi:predicted DCC family thiol-disulfide oxidoreductase YuxK